MSDQGLKSAPLLPPDAGRDTPLFAVAAILVFLAGLAGLGGVGAWRAADDWTNQLTNEVTVQILPTEGRDADADARDGAEALRAIAGVRGVDVRSRAQSEALLEPWLGSGGLPEDLPVPRLIAVELDPTNRPLAGSLEAALADKPYRAALDDHGNWAEAVARASQAVRYFALVLVVLLSLAASAVVAFAARASLAARWDVADALHIVGAPDTFIATLFQQRFFLLGLKAGTLGALGAGLAGAGLAYAGGTAGALFFLPTLSLGWMGLIILPIAALASGFIAALSARLAVSDALHKRWS
ncbi:cell division protein FtsX [Woodsholea maritima]|uniref:cell division protein FtsX n=1 Tax=Woodsholea maritima TaxID=240237 RepID=UPI00036EC445|nr:hypothetical protein [Woodsholea maritima]